MGRFWFVLLAVLASFPVSVTLADTTWVSGALSGELTRNGSPYIVVDSTWIPAGEQLVLREGVHLYFNEGQAFWVFGRLMTIGLQDDSVMIRVSEGAEHWRGIRLLSRDSHLLEYTSIVCPDTALIAMRGAFLEFRFLRVDAGVAALSHVSGSYRDNTSWHMTLLNTTLRAPYPIEGERISLIASNSRIETGNNEYSEGTAIYFTESIVELDSCTVIGKCFNSQGLRSIYRGCDFLRRAEGGSSWVGLYGVDSYMDDCYVEGGVSGDCSWNPVLFQITNSIILDDVLVSEVNLDITDCIINGDVSGGETYVNILRSTVKGDFGAAASGHCLVQNCYIGDLNSPAGINIMGEHQNHSGILRMDKCFVAERRLTFVALDSLLITNCTFIADSLRLYYIHLINAPEERIHDGWHFINNIFYTTHPVQSLFSNPGRNVALPTFMYNSISGFDNLVYANGNMQLDSTNLTDEPELIWDDSVIRPGPTSPLIDAGDPRYPPDPDGSRSDIGAFYFPQPNLCVEPRIIETEVTDALLTDTLSLNLSNSGIDTLLFFLEGGLVDTPFRFLNWSNDTVKLRSGEMYSLLIEVKPTDRFTRLDSITVHSTDRDEPILTILLIANFYNGLGEEAISPVPFILSPYPNPCNSSVNLEINLPSAGQFKSLLYDVSGRVVMAFAELYLNAGSHKIVFDMNGVSTGLYFMETLLNGRRDRFKLYVIK